MTNVNLHRESGCYGGMFQYNQNTVIPITIVDTFYPIYGMSHIHSSSCEFQNGGELKSFIPGRHLIDYSISVQNGHNTDYVATIAVNSTPQDSSYSRNHIEKDDDIIYLGGTTFVDLQDNDVITLVIKNITNNNQATIIHANLTLFRVGINM